MFYCVDEVDDDDDDDEATSATKMFDHWAFEYD